MNENELIFGKLGYIINMNINNISTSQSAKPFKENNVEKSTEPQYFLSTHDNTLAQKHDSVGVACLGVSVGVRDIERIISDSSPSVVFINSKQVAVDLIL